MDLAFQNLTGVQKQRLTWNGGEFQLPTDLYYSIQRFLLVLVTVFLRFGMKLNRQTAFDLPEQSARVLADYSGPQNSDHALS